jgi:hypothetical protein
MALGACGETAIQYRVPTLNKADRARLSCAEYPEIRETLAELPPHAFLSGSSGEPVVTPDGRKWVAFDVVNQREGALIKFGMSPVDRRISSAAMISDGLPRSGPSWSARPSADRS